MPASAQTVFQPRKTPVQARSAASVDAMLEATLQVLLQVGKERLTTTRVAERAGVSVGTLYQYFPNKSSLLQATLRCHFDDVVAAILHACEEERGKPMADMGVALADKFLAAKIKDGKTSVALYAIASDVDGFEIAQEMRHRTHTAIRTLLETASDGPVRDLDMVTTVCVGIMSGLSRQFAGVGEPGTAVSRVPAGAASRYRRLSGQLRLVAEELLVPCSDLKESIWSYAADGGRGGCPLAAVGIAKAFELDPLHAGELLRVEERGVVMRKTRGWSEGQLLGGGAAAGAACREHGRASQAVKTHLCFHDGSCISG